MPNFKVSPGHRLSADGVIVEGGDTVTLSKEQGEALVEEGVLEAPKVRGRRAGWTGDESDADKSDADKTDGEGGEG